MSNNELTIEYLTPFTKLSFPECSKTKMGFFTGVMKTISDFVDKQTPISKTRCKNIANRWSTMLSNNINDDLRDEVYAAGFVQEFWDRFAKVGGVNYTAITNQREQRRQRNEEYRKNRGVQYSALLRMTLEINDNDGVTVSTKRVFFKDPSFRLPRLRDSDNLYGFNVPNNVIDRIYEGKSSELEGEHVLCLEWKRSRDGKRFFCQIASFADDKEPDHELFDINKLGGSEKNKRRRNVHRTVHTGYFPMTVKMIRSGQFKDKYKVYTPAFKLAPNEDGIFYFFNRVGDNKYGFPHVPSEIINDLFQDTDLESYEGQHTFKCNWRVVSDNGKERVYPVLAELANDVEVELEYIDPDSMKRKIEARIKNNSANRKFSTSVADTVARRNGERNQ